MRSGYDNVPERRGDVLRRQDVLRRARQQTVVRSGLEEILSAESLAGKSFLHVGCSSGNLCRRALEQGATQATGIDISREKIELARAAACPPGKEASFIAADFEQWDAPPQTFDMVACSNILHHLYEPVAAIRKMMRLAGERLALVVAPGSPVSSRRASALRRLWEPFMPPQIALGDRTMAIRAADQTFFLSRDALQIIINRHSKAFEPLQFTDLPAGGCIVEARRRRIDHLVIVAGSTASGKSSLIRRFAEPEFGARFGIEPEFKLIKPEEIEQLPPGRRPTVILHYDLLRPFGRALHSHERDPAFHLLQCAERTTLITVAQSAKVLAERLQMRGALQGMDPSNPRLERAQLKQQLYLQSSLLRTWYEAWLDATAPYVSRPVDRSHFVLADEQCTELGDRDALLKLFEPEAVHSKKVAVPARA